MIALPISSRFFVKLPRKFIYDQIRNNTKRYFDSLGGPYEDVIDYINATVLDVRIPGISNNDNPVQLTNKGGRTFFRGGWKAEDKINKELTIQFQLKEGYLNWIILYQQFLYYLDGSKNNQSEAAFLPDITAFILDDQDSIIVEMKYKDITFKSISDVTLSVSDSGVSVKTFEVVLVFSHFELSFGMDTIDMKDDKNFEYSY